MNQFLKDDAYYHDLYDLWTIQECLRIRDFWDKRIKELKSNNVMGARLGLDLQLYFVKGERYRNKTITQCGWIEADRGRDDKLIKAKVPEGINCLVCHGSMRAISKDLYDFSPDSLRVMFFFECPLCGKRRGIFEDGQEYVSKGAKLSKDEMNNWAKEDIERKDREKREQELLRQYRDEFCLSEADGEEFILNTHRLDEFADYLKETELRKADPAYMKALKLKKLTIVELEKFLKRILEKEKYIRLTFEKPMIDKHVIVSLTAQDENSTRDEYASVRNFQRILKKALEDTNWRLMSEGVNYRLGYLFCKLKGYEQEADLIQIVKSRKYKS